MALALWRIAEHALIPALPALHLIHIGVSLFVTSTAADALIVAKDAKQELATALDACVRHALRSQTAL